MSVFKSNFDFLSRLFRAAGSHEPKWAQGEDEGASSLDISLVFGGKTDHTKVRPRSCSTSCRKLIISEPPAYFKTTLGPRRLWRSIPEGIQCRARNCWTGFYWGRPSELNLPSLGTFIFYFINCRKALNRLEQSGCATPSDLRGKFNMFMERGSAVSITSDPQQCFHARLLKPALRDTDSHVDVFLHDSWWQQTFSGSLGCLVRVLSAKLTALQGYWFHFSLLNKYSNNFLLINWSSHTISLVKGSKIAGKHTDLC